MENQHRRIEGYRELNQGDIDDINYVKNVARTVEQMISDIEANQEYDQRWMSIARTDLQKGFMAAVRSIAKPDFF